MRQKSGARNQDRTDDIHITRVVLYQLSYPGKNLFQQQPESLMRIQIVPVYWFSLLEKATGD